MEAGLHGQSDVLIERPRDRFAHHLMEMCGHVRRPRIALRIFYR
jgi:hypothetical protein